VAPVAQPRWRGYPPRLACKAANTFSAVSGKSITRTPTASHTTLAMAAATGVLLLSPMPLLWYGVGPGSRRPPAPRLTRPRPVAPEAADTSKNHPQKQSRLAAHATPSCSRPPTTARVGLSASAPAPYRAYRVGPQHVLSTHIRSDRHAQGIKNRLPDFALRRIRTMILAGAKRKQACFGHGRLRPHASAIAVHPFGRQLIDTHRLLVQGGFELGPPAVVMPVAQPTFEPSIRAIEALEGWSRCRPKRPKPSSHPRFDVHESMITPGQKRAEPDRGPPAQAEALPVAVSGKVVIS
jgi:hypothetical protein